MAVIRFPRTVRLDHSDSSVFAHAAQAGEWAVTGTFAFADIPQDLLKGKTRQAFANGWLGVGSFGFATLVEVAEMGADDFDAVSLNLAEHFVQVYGAPSVDAALPVARDEVSYASGLCNHPLGTLLTISREWKWRGIREKISLVPGFDEDRDEPVKAWKIVGEQSLPIGA
ncbi:MAG: DUF6505 family protein [Rhodospirillales bacterium]